MTIISSTSNITLTTTSVLQSSANLARRGIILQVKSGGVATIKFDTGITRDNNGITDGIDVVGQLIIDQFCPSGQVFMMAAAANTVVTYTEFLEV